MNKEDKRRKELREAILRGLAILLDPDGDPVVYCFSLRTLYDLMVEWNIREVLFRPSSKRDTWEGKTNRLIRSQVEESINFLSKALKNNSES